MIPNLSPGAKLSLLALFLLLCFHIYLGYFTKLYYHFPRIDLVMHSLASALLVLPIQKGLNTTKRTVIVLTIFTLAIGWELVEYTYEVFTQSHASSSWFESIKDVIVTTLAALLPAHWITTHSQKKPFNSRPT